MRPLFLVCSVCVPLLLAGTLEAKNPVLKPSIYKTTIFKDDFSIEKWKPEWKSHHSASVIKKGILVAITPEGANHSAVNAVFIKPKADLEVSVDFKFAGSPGFNVQFLDSQNKASLAGHICHLAISPNRLKIYDGKTGKFRLDVREKMKKKKLDAATLKMLKTKSIEFPLKLDPKKWHTLVIRIQKNLMTTYIDGQEIGQFKSPGIAHQRKEQINLTTIGKEMHYDNFTIKGR